MCRERGLDQNLALEQFVRRDDDPQYELEPEHGLAQGGPDGGLDVRTLDPGGCSRPGRRLTDQAVLWGLEGRLGQLRTNAALEIAEGMRLVEPAQDELGRGEGGLELGESSLGGHVPPAGWVMP
jgi:hypothetical protein